MDRLTSLTTFIRVVDSGGFSAAGRRLNMSTTMVSNHIRALEERLGARLLHRTTRKVSLTEVGKAYYDRCTQILADLEQADEIAGALQSTPRGKLRIHTSTHLVPFVAPAVTEFLASYPGVTIDLNMGEREIDMIDEGFDLAIRLTPPPDFEPHLPQPCDVAPCTVLLAGLHRKTWIAAPASRTDGAQLRSARALSLRR